MIKPWQLGLFESMASSTPVKVERIDCFVYFSKNVTTFKLKGRKLKGENFYCKLKQVVRDDVAGTTTLDREWLTACFTLSSILSIM